MSEYLSDDQIKRLFAIKGNKWFVYFAEQMVKDLVEDTEPFWKNIESAKVAKQINNEIGNLKDSLKGLSEDARSCVNQALGGNDFLLNDGLDMIPIILYRLDRINAQKSLTKRLQIGDDALHQFNVFKLKATTYYDGAFVEYLDIILTASGLSFRAVVLAKNILSR